MKEKIDALRLQLEKELEKFGSTGLSKPPIPVSFLAAFTEKTVATVTALPTINAHKEMKQILFFVEDIIFLITFSINLSILYPIIFSKFLNQFLKFLYFFSKNYILLFLFQTN